MFEIFQESEVKEKEVKYQKVKIVYMNRPITHCDKCGSRIKYMWNGVMWCMAGGHTFYTEEVLTER